MKLCDDVMEQQKKGRKREMLEQDDNQPKKKKSRRLGPETWKLRGAAHPAWKVYDFDTGCIDPYLQQHAEARAKHQRSVVSFHRRSHCSACPVGVHGETVQQDVHPSITHSSRRYRRVHEAQSGFSLSLRVFAGLDLM